MKWYDGFDILPVSMAGCDPCSSILSSARDKTVYHALSLCLCQGRLCECVHRVPDGLYLPDTMQPVLNSRSKDNVCEGLVISCLDEYKEGRFIAGSHLGVEVDVGQGTYKDLEFLSCALFVCFRP